MLIRSESNFYISECRPPFYVAFTSLTMTNQFIVILRAVDLLALATRGQQRPGTEAHSQLPKLFPGALARS
jgi:hypothetical protein